MSTDTETTPFDDELGAAPAGVVVPDMAGEVVGWRAWQLVGTDKNLHLFSVTMQAIWFPGQWMRAVCPYAMQGKHPVSSVPDEKCLCGLYAAESREHLVSLGYNDYTHYHSNGRPRVIGEVGMVGKVIPGTQGWRAEKARPLHLYVPYEHWHIAAQLEIRYGVAVSLSNVLENR